MTWADWLAWGISLMSFCLVAYAAGYDKGTMDGFLMGREHERNLRAEGPEKVKTLREMLIEMRRK